MSTAGILIIGNEILTNKVQDENAPYLLRELRGMGVDVRRVHVIPDVIHEIADEVRAFSRQFSYVLTTGGVGPTHDDVTMDGAALAFGRKLELNAGMDQLLRSSLRGREPNASQVKMCMLPEGSELIQTPDLWFPLIKLENVFIFPGIPRLLRAKFEALRPMLEGRPVFLRRVFLSCIESDIAEFLNEIVREFAELDVGSYPAVEKLDYRTQITLESRDENLVARAVKALVGKLPADVLLRVE
jgi:molybdenum cofactor synthesis domain-containing protein